MISLPTSIPSNRSRMAPDLENLGLSGMTCNKCKKHLTADEENELLTECFYTHECGKELYMEDVKVKVLHRYQHLLNLNKAQQQPFWYHATSDVGWPKVNKIWHEGEVWLAHVGSKESALDRATHQGYGFMYKLTIDPCAYWSPSVTDDWNEWPTSLADLEGEFYQNFSEVTRYVNRYEIPGSVSLLVASDKIRVVGYEEIQKPIKENNSDSANGKLAVPCP